MRTGRKHPNDPRLQVALGDAGDFYLEGVADHATRHEHDYTGGGKTHCLALVGGALN